MIGKTGRVRGLILSAAVLCLVLKPFTLRADVADSYFRADTPFPQYSYFWSDSSNEEVELFGGKTDFLNAQRALGGSIHVYIINTSKSPVKVDDITLEGISLKRAIAFSEKRKFKKVAKAASIYFSDLPEAERGKLISVGEPVWYKIEPQKIMPGESGQVVIRLRHIPKDSKVNLAVVYDGGNARKVPVSFDINRPEIADISFQPGLDTAYIYLKHPEKGKVPSKILMDGQDITALSSVVSDPMVDIVPVVCNLKTPLTVSSFHCFQAVYADGSKATAGRRAYGGEMIYAVWGGKPGKASEPEIGRAFIQELAEHNVNVQMETAGSDAVRVFMNSPEGKATMKSLGISRIVSEPAKWEDPAAYYLADEPDTGDFRVEGVPQTSKIGCLGQGLAARAEELRGVNTAVPNMLNLDMTFKPDNWYTYGQLPDVFAADPYYQSRLCQAYWSMPGRIPVYSKCTFVYAVGSVCRSACAPNPLHIILNSVRSTQKDRKFRWGTPEEKRIEVYYALAAGAKAFSYWWYTPLGPNGTGADGCGNPDPDAIKLWREIGLLGAEVRTAGQVITKSCPASVDISGPKKLWVRSLLSGRDTLVLLCVNDDYANDRLGTVIQPLEKADVTVDLPGWINGKDVFEVDFNGIHDVPKESNGKKMTLHLGTVNVSRMVIVTDDAGLKDGLKKLYDSKYGANSARLTSITQ